MIKIISDDYDTKFNCPKFTKRALARLVNYDVAIESRIRFLQIPLSCVVCTLITYLIIPNSFLFVVGTLMCVNYKFSNI